LVAGKVEKNAQTDAPQSLAAGYHGWVAIVFRGAGLSRKPVATLSFDPEFCVEYVSRRTQL
jgi:hypothetical protein